MKVLTSPIVIIVLAVLFSAGPVLALLWKESAALIQAQVAQKAEEHEASRPEKPWDFWTPEVENLAKELAAQRERYEAREAELDARENRLTAEARQLEGVRTKIAQMREEIDTLVVDVKEQEVRNLKSLAATYSKLSPAAAVAIFSQLDDLMVAKLLSLMKPEVTSAILEELVRAPGPANVNIKRAAELSQRLRLLLPAPKTAG